MRSWDDICASEYSYVPALDRGDNEKAKLIARTTVNELKTLLGNPPPEKSEEFLQSVFYLSVFFRTLYDFAALKELTSPDDWVRNRESLEAVWVKLCDCKERLEFVRSAVAGDTVERIANDLAELEAFYFTHFGQGLYVSPVLLVKRAFCTICKKDIRCCAHLSGRVYAGRRCAAIPDTVGLEMKSCDFVQIPRDLRCRIWPWQVKEDKLLGIKILTIFQIDDFIETDEWE